MKRTDWLILTQSIASGLQVVNAGIAAATHNLLVALIVAGICAALQTAVQQMGNQTHPEIEKEKDASGT